MNKKSIKFRAWNKEEQEMIPADAWYFSDEFEPFVDSVKRAQKDFELMQFTGLTDVNGIEIYEGDVLQIKDWDERITNIPKPQWIRGSVYFAYGAFRIHAYIACTVTNFAEIIGNIYQNPELIDF